MSNRLTDASQRVRELASPLAPTAVFSPEAEAKAIQRIEECLDAVRRVRVRLPDGSVGYENIPDYPIRMATGFKIVEFNIGKPIQRTITADLTPQNAASPQETLLQMLRAHPAEAKEIGAKLAAVIDLLAVEEAKQVQQLPPEPPASS